MILRQKQTHHQKNEVLQSPKGHDLKIGTRFLDAHERHGLKAVVLHRSRHQIERNRNTYFVESISPVALFMLKKKAEGLLKGIFIPDSLIAEIDGYARRNNALSMDVDGDSHAVCPSCLKAHALRKASEFGLDEGAFHYLEKIFAVRSGHDGYYTDGNELIKI